MRRERKVHRRQGVILMDYFSDDSGTRHRSSSDLDARDRDDRNRPLRNSRLNDTQDASVCSIALLNC